MRHLRTLKYALALLLIAAVARATDLYHVDLHQPGSATIIRQRSHDGIIKTIVVDTGNQSATAGRGGRAVRKQLDRLGIDHIDLLIITHLDTDHYAGYEPLLTLPGAAPQEIAGEANAPRGPPIKAVLRPRFDRDTSTTLSFTRAFTDRKIPIVTPTEEGTLHELEQEFGITVLAPHQPRTTNDSSLLVAIHDSNVRGMHVITGDLTTKSWRALAPTLPHRRVLSMTAPHHGGDDVLLPMVDALHPDVIIMSANRDNQFRHPSLRVLRELARRAYPATADVRASDLLRLITRAAANADKEYLELLQSYYKVAPQALQSPAVAAATHAEAEATAIANQVRATPSSFVLSEHLRITADNGTIHQHSATLREHQPSLREKVITEAVLRATARLTDQQVEEFRSWSLAARELRAGILEELEHLRRYYDEQDAHEREQRQSEAGRFLRPISMSRPPDPPMGMAEYERIVMDITRTSDPTHVSSALRQACQHTGPAIPDANKRIALIHPSAPIPPLADLDAPLRELRERIAQVEARTKKVADFDLILLDREDAKIEIRLPSQNYAAARDKLALATPAQTHDLASALHLTQHELLETQMGLKQVQDRALHTAVLLPPELWDESRSWKTYASINDGIRKRAIEKEPEARVPPPHITPEQAQEWYLIHRRRAGPAPRPVDHPVDVHPIEAIP